jgi:nucleoside-diphosphate-sugar epimerase
MPDAIAATIKLMEAGRSELSINCAYNLGGMSITPDQVYREIRKEIPDFTISYRPDFRQDIADTWPRSVDDSVARRDWGFEQNYKLDRMSEIMLKEIRNKLK